MITSAKLKNYNNSYMKHDFIKEKGLKILDKIGEGAFG